MMMENSDAIHEERWKAMNGAAVMMKMIATRKRHDERRLVWSRARRLMGYKGIGY